MKDIDFNKLGAAAPPPSRRGPTPDTEMSPNPSYRRPIPENIEEYKYTEYSPRIDPNLDTDYVLRVDEKIRATITLLRDAGSLLILRPDQIEREEEEATAEIFCALTNVARCKRMEEMAKESHGRVEAEAYKVENAKTSHLPKNAQPAVTDIKKIAACDPSVKAAHDYYLDCLEERRQAEAYAEALKQKMVLIPGMQGNRNRSVG